jgi:GH15 family glucan-1,4-alpha-glucosidase
VVNPLSSGVRRAYPPIADYALIGDCRSAALVSHDGSIDWLCLPRFDSPSFFGALLDTRCGGSFRVAPAGPAQVARRYVGNSNVLETTFTTPGGVVRLTDTMAVADEATKTRTLWPDHELLRGLECVEGEVELEVRYEPRPDYGRASGALRPGLHQTILCEHGRSVMVLRSGVPLTISGDRGTASGRLRMKAGERTILGLSFADGMAAVLPADGDHAWAMIDASVRWWEAWADQLTYDWRYRETIRRSALVLKLLTYAPSGAMVAAPTTSLPEKMAGIRNWDYRYCWLRDASLTLRALVDAGFPDEAEAFVSWLLHATRLTQPRLQILYDVYGESELPERELPHLEGYRGSRPVRVGNDAASQLQLDVYGEVIDAVFLYIEHGGRIDRTTAKMLRGLGRTVCAMWREPDEGIWEPRSGRRHNTHSKVMCWVALDRLVMMAEAGHISGSVAGFVAERDAIRVEIEARAWNATLGSYTAAFDSDTLDASLLRMATCGFANPRGERMCQTVERVRRDLGHNGFLYRYIEPDGLPQGEGAFVICSFWLVEALALQGRIDEASAEFERLVACANDVGLLAEQIDPDSRELLGNFPQAFSHIGLINAAETLAACAGEPQAQPAVRAERRV